MAVSYTAPVIPCAPEPALVESAHRAVARAAEIETAMKRMAEIAEDEPIPESGVLLLRWDGRYPSKLGQKLARVPGLRRFAHRTATLGVGSWTASLADDGAMEVYRESCYTDDTTERLHRRPIACGFYYTYERGGGIPIMFSQMRDGRLFFH